VLKRRGSKGEGGGDWARAVKEDVRKAGGNNMQKEFWGEAFPKRYLFLD